jgi:hypothetical protein
MSETVSVALPIWFRVLARYVADRNGMGLEQFLAGVLLDNAHDALEEAVELSVRYLGRRSTLDADDDASDGWRGT